MSTELAVWAPNARSLEVEIEGDRFVMIKDERSGWWQSPAAAMERAAGGEARYTYFVDGDGPFPDPRSRRQPEGVHGPSQLVRHDAFWWQHNSFQPRPPAAAVIYELHVGTFTEAGTFDAAAQRLPELRELGVTHVELMPVAAFPGRRNWGYDGVALFAPHEGYGGPDGLKRLVDACHAYGMAVVLDVVYNHLGPEGNYLGKFAPYFTDTYRTPWGDAVNLDGPGSDEVRRFLVDNACMWLRDYRFDALRLDAVHALHDESAEHFLAELSREVRALEAATGRHLTLIAESDLNDPRVVRSREAGGYGIEAQWSDDFHHAVHALLSGERAGYYADFGAVSHLRAALEQVFVYDGCYSAHRGRRHGAPVGDLPRRRFLGYSQNHDQVGNRAVGERLCHLVSPGRARIAAAWTLLSPFVPLIFQGEEWAASTPFQYFTDHGDPGLGEGVREGRRQEFAAFGWQAEDIPDPQRRETARRSTLRWEERSQAKHADMLSWYRQLLALRKREPSLGCSRDTVPRVYEGPEGVVSIVRGEFVVAANLGAEPCKVDSAALLESVAGRSADRETVVVEPAAGAEHRGRYIELEPDGCAVVRAARSEDETRAVTPAR